MESGDVAGLLQVLVQKVDLLASGLAHTQEQVEVLGQYVQRIELCTERIDQRVERIEERVERIEERTERIEERVEQIDLRLGVVETDVRNLKIGLAAVEKRQAVLETQVREGFKQMDYRLLELERDVHQGYELIGKKFDETQQWQEKVEQRHQSSEHWKKNVEQQLDRLLNSRGKGQNL